MKLIDDSFISSRKYYHKIFDCKPTCIVNMKLVNDSFIASTKYYREIFNQPVL